MGRYYVDYCCFRYCNKIGKLNKLLSISRVLRVFLLTVVVWSLRKIYKGMALRISQGNGGY